MLDAPNFSNYFRLFITCIYLVLDWYLRKEDWIIKSVRAAHCIGLTVILNLLLPRRIKVVILYVNGA